MDDDMKTDGTTPTDEPKTDGAACTGEGKKCEGEGKKCEGMPAEEPAA